MTTAVTNRTATSTWIVDPAHSSAEFSVRHMMVSTVKGRFGAFEGIVHLDEAAPQRSRVEASLDVASIDTGVADRDAHLRSDDFFNADRYPKIHFAGTAIERVDDQRWSLAGNLTIRDVTRPVVLEVEYHGRGIDAYGKERAGFTAETRVNRKDFGVNWNGVIEAGGVVVADTVKIVLNVAVVRQD